MISIMRPDVTVGVSTIENLDTLCGGACMALLGLATPAAKRFAQVGLYLGLPLFIYCTGHMFLTGEHCNRHDTPDELIIFCVNHGQQFAITLLSIYAVWRCAKGVPGLAGKLLLWRPLVYLGTISYGLYVIHNFIHFLWRYIGTELGLPGSLMWDHRWRLPFVFAITIALAALSWHFFEKPINRLKKHFPYLPKK